MGKNPTIKVFFGMNSKNLHIVPRDDGWGVRREGASRVSSIHDTQSAAERVARQTAIREGGETFIHRPSGEIRNRNSYGNDPFPPRG
jgi:hypothetical protein